ncbi:MAG: hypothetical protein J6S85_03885 [Methanobrevibacter sp.]|nr:hypothetical protein [Methanobrevibacter sp.]MBO7712683.1 hypothetical protein [Methanobrevibacter sp.]
MEEDITTFDNEPIDNISDDRMYVESELERYFNSPEFLEGSGFSRVEVHLGDEDKEHWDEKVKKVGSVSFGPDDSVTYTMPEIDDNYIPITEEDYNEWNNQREEAIDDYENRKSLEEEYDVELPDSQWEQQSRFSSDDGALANKTIEEAANIKQTSPNKVSAMKEVYDGFKYGCYEALRSLQEMGSWLGWKVAETVTGGNIDFDPMKDTEGVGFNQGESPEPETVAGSISKAATQGIAGYVLGSGAMKLAGSAVKSLPAIGKALSVAGKNPWGKRLINMTVDSAKGFISDTIAFNANEGNFMEMLKELGLPTVDVIVKEGDDGFWTKKIKNGVDGILAGAIIGFIGGTAKLIWKTIPAEAKMAATVSTGAGYGINKLEELSKDNSEGINK